MTLQSNGSIHSFDWDTARIQFSSFQGDAPVPGSLIESWPYTGADIPPEGATNARLNLWLLNGSPPADGQTVEVIVESFEFVPRMK
jgi:hypothetical protein